VTSGHEAHLIENLPRLTSMRSTFVVIILSHFILLIFSFPRQPCQISSNLYRTIEGVDNQGFNHGLHLAKGLYPRLSGALLLVASPLTYIRPCLASAEESLQLLNGTYQYHTPEIVGQFVVFVLFIYIPYAVVKFQSTL